MYIQTLDPPPNNVFIQHITIWEHTFQTGLCMLLSWKVANLAPGDFDSQSLA